MPPATRQLDQVSGCGSGTALVTARVMLLIDRLPFSTLHDFDADPVGRRDIAQETPADALLQFDWEVDALRAQPGAEGGEVTLVQKPEMIGAPFIVAGVIGVGPDRPCKRGILARALAADQDRHAAQLDKDLRRAARHGIASDSRPEHLDIPSRRGMRVLADDVDVIEFEGRIAHPFAPIGAQRPHQPVSCQAPAVMTTTTARGAITEHTALRDLNAGAEAVAVQSITLAHKGGGAGHQHRRTGGTDDGLIRSAAIGAALFFGHTVSRSN